MSAIYDNWERLVDATLKREKFRELALAPSRETSFNSSISSTTFSSISLQSNSAVDYEPGSLIYQVITAAEDAGSFKQERAELKFKAEKLVGLLREVARASNNLYDRPTRRITVNANVVLEKTLMLLLKCSVQGIKRVFNVIPADAFGKMSSLLENAIRDVSWLLSVSSSAATEEEYLGVPPIAATEPLLCVIWEQIGVLYTGSLEAKSDAAAVLLFLARENDQSRKLIIEEGGIQPLLNLMSVGKLEGQENAVKAMGWLGNDPEFARQIIDAGACRVFVRMLRQDYRIHVKVQAAVAWAVSELATHYPRCQDFFAQERIIFSLAPLIDGPVGNRARETEDPATLAHLKAMAARALCRLAKGNHSICKTITETSTLRSLATLLEKGPDQEVQNNSAMALMEITAVAEQDAELRRSAFNPNRLMRKFVVDQLLRVVETMGDRDSKLLVIPCIKAIGSLSRIFKTNETRIICPILKLLMDQREIEVSSEICIALTKFANSDNYLCAEYAKVIISDGGLKHVIELVYSGNRIVQSHALILLCYITMNAPEIEQLGQEKVVDVLEWASKQSLASQDQYDEDLLPLAKKRLELHQSGR